MHAQNEHRFSPELHASGRKSPHFPSSASVWNIALYVNCEYTNEWLFEGSISQFCREFEYSWIYAFFVLIFGLTKCACAIFHAFCKSGFIWQNGRPRQKFNRRIWSFLYCNSVIYQTVAFFGSNMVVEMILRRSQCLRHHSEECLLLILQWVRHWGSTSQPVWYKC